MAVAGQKYSFFFGTIEQYKNAKTASTIDANALYFITDTKQIYLGNDLYSGAVEFVEAFPQSPSQGILYCNPTTHETKMYDGSAWKVVVPAVETVIEAGTTGTNLANINAIRNYIASTVSSDVTDIEYNAVTAELTVHFKGEEKEDKVINLPKENFLSSASYDGDTHILTLTLQDTTTVTVNLEDLIDVYTGSETNSATVNVTGNVVTADVKISSAAGNALTVKSGDGEKGLFVEVPEAYVKSVSDTKTASLAVSEGALTANVKVSATAGNKITTNADGLFVAETDLSNYYNKTEVDALISWKTIA